MFIPKKKATQPKKKTYQVVAVVESRRCPKHGAALVSEAIEGKDGQLTVPMYRGRKVLHCPFCNV